MNLYCIKCLMLTKSNHIKVKHKINGKMNLHLRCDACSFKNLPLLISRDYVIY